MVERARKLENAEEASEGTSANYTSNRKALTSLFCANSRDGLVTLLGVSKEEIVNKVSKAIER